jgi:hypothetical protein
MNLSLSSGLLEIELNELVQMSQIWFHLGFRVEDYCRVLFFVAFFLSAVVQL